MSRASSSERKLSPREDESCDARVPPKRALPSIARLWKSSAARYLLVGGLCFLADLGLLWLFYNMVGLPLAIATPVAFLLSFAITYSAQRLVAFRAPTRVAPSVVRYTLLVAFNTLATTLIVWGLDQIGAGWVAGKVVAVASTTVWNYFAYRYWVFAERHDGGRRV